MRIIVRTPERAIILTTTQNGSFGFPAQFQETPGGPDVALSRTSWPPKRSLGGALVCALVWALTLLEAAILQVVHDGILMDL